MVVLMADTRLALVGVPRRYYAKAVMTAMAFDYFCGQQSDQFAFYRISKVLFTDERFWNVSTDAKLLYGILLDRLNISAKTVGLMKI